ncbi:TlpA disulfide reductase family protein [Bacteroides finegoldii]|uniref:TlpA disulfide reductase family protein n=1 Tax=Bacteroides finegoldii TaxID=338188 RepID=UPI00189F662E|nr:TlpA disulfide reductase family protein [Bacteroides finegoldii]
MKTFTLFIAMLSCVFTYTTARALPADGKKATISFTAETNGKKIYFQSESDTIHGYQEVKPGETVTLQLEKPAYYYYMHSNGKTCTYFVTPGSASRIIDKNGQVSFEGDNAEINRFLQQHPSFTKIPDNITMYSKEWLDLQHKRLSEAIEALKTSGLPADFIHIQEYYYKYSILTQLLAGPAMMRMFMKKDLELPANYYDDIKKNRYEDAVLLYYPKWFTVMRESMETLEKVGEWEPDPTNFLSQYAARIANDEVKAAFLVRYLKQILKAGYSEDFPTYLSIAKSSVPQPDEAFLRQLTQLEQQHNEMKVQYSTITRGNSAPAFTANDVNGKACSSSDYAGKVMVLDFWFSGCIPCKAEMPYMEKLAEKMQEKNIQFFTLSLDTGDQLLKAWQTLVKDKNGATLQLNVPGGFKSELAKHYGIRSVPRIVIIDQQGKIVDAFAKRPSDPKLYQQLLKLLGEENTGKLTKEKLSATMQALMRAETAEQKEEILKNITAEVKKEKAEFAYPMVNMMTSFTIQALYAEGKQEKAEEYLSHIADSPFKRDILAISGSKCFENGNFKPAAGLLERAVNMTIGDKDINALSEEERNKYRIILSLYVEALIKTDRTQDAIPYAKQAYELSNKHDFSINNCYATTLVAEKKFSDARPLLEEFVRTGKASPQHTEWLKQAYIQKNGKEKGFEPYMNGLKADYRKSLQERLAQEMVNEPAPMFTLRNMKGEEVSLSNLKGKVVVLDFWATWCGPCKASFPAMQETINQFADNKDVVFLFINTLDTKKNLQEIVQKYMNEKGYTFNVLFDTQDAATKKYPVKENYKIKGIPAKFIIDKEGNIRFKPMGFSGSNEETVKELSAMIEVLL